MIVCTELSYSFALPLLNRGSALVVQTTTPATRDSTPPTRENSTGASKTHVSSSGSILDGLLSQGGTVSRHLRGISS